jgi:hypothetical protein
MYKYANLMKQARIRCTHTPYVHTYIHHNCHEPGVRLTIHAYLHTHIHIYTELVKHASTLQYVPACMHTYRYSFYEPSVM